MESENKDIVRTFFEECVNKEDYERMNEMISEDFIGHNFASSQKLRGREALKDFFRNHHDVLEGLRYEIELMIAEGDKVVTKVVASGVHTGEFGDLDVDLSSTGNSVESTGIVIDTLEDGEIIASHRQFDMLELLRQMDVELVSSTE